MVGFDIPAEVISVLKKLGMIVVFGNTDDQGNDLMEINGVVSEKFGVDPHVILASGKIMPESHVKSDELVIGRIEPQCHKEENPDGWSYKTDIPHATFRICYKDADDYCVGLVIDYVALVKTAGR